MTSTTFSYWKKGGIYCGLGAHAMVFSTALTAAERQRVQKLLAEELRLPYDPEKDRVIRVPDFRAGTIEKEVKAILQRLTAAGEQEEDGA